jgi:hypothetical protein
MSITIPTNIINSQNDCLNQKNMWCSIICLPIIIPIMLGGNHIILKTKTRNDSPWKIKKARKIPISNRFIFSPYSTLYPIPQTVFINVLSIPEADSFSLRFLMCESIVRSSPMKSIPHTSSTNCSLDKAFPLC